MEAFQAKPKMQARTRIFLEFPMFFKVFHGFSRFFLDFHGVHMGRVAIAVGLLDSAIGDSLIRHLKARGNPKENGAPPKVRVLNWKFPFLSLASSRLPPCFHWVFSSGFFPSQGKKQKSRKN